MNQETLQELFVEQIGDIYDAEKQLVKALPKLADAATSEELAEALRTHLDETEAQVARLEEVFAIVGQQPKGKPCKAMKGLIEEGNEAAKEEEGELRDLAIIAACQRVEHYEISAYGTAKAIANRLSLDDAVQLLEQTEEEEADADAELTSVAEMIYDSVEEGDELPGADEESNIAIAARAAVGATSKSEPAKKAAAKAGATKSSTKRSTGTR
jgi:ferritin-like metal-binding protein YciE